MATNKIPESPIETVFALAGDMADGAVAQGASIGLVQNTQTTIAATSDGKKTPPRRQVRQGDRGKRIAEAPTGAPTSVGD